jgi:hypothetical protein
LKVRDIDPLALFDQHAQGIWPDDQKDLFDFLEELISHVVFSFTALEAFANQVIRKTSLIRSLLRRMERSALTARMRLNVESI